ncbi:MAG TPA: glycoside hydrolase family 2 TIM barrel-domain containing protein [Candidatus Saccharimonadales bacterium]|nr:glycoside hydrolase family 2 TIM barrel-domain containing protein [Candidatus Saccharimonadales bacterium]
MNNNENLSKPAGISRREFTRRSTLGTIALASSSILGFGLSKAKADSVSGPANFRVPLEKDWLFGGKFDANSITPQMDGKGFAQITLPHCVAKLSWENWDPAAWQSVWLYRRHLAFPKEWAKRRVFLKFDGVMIGAKPVINGVALPEHIGAYLPFQYELTQWLKEGDNILDVAVDARWQSAPPDGSPKGAKAVDYLEPGGIGRSVSLCVLPEFFISDVFAKPVNVLESGRRLEVLCTVNAIKATAKSFQIKVDLMDGARVVASAQKPLAIENDGDTEVALTLSDLGTIDLWDVDAPRLYDVVTTLSMEGEALHDHRTRIGFREARFTVDGFFLNGHRKQLFGLDRHELFPYVGGAMPRRVMRRDAEILRHEFNVNIVRCSHYPQSEAFLEACDELGLMVWQETPGWGYLGDQAWKELVVRDVKEMIVRDRNHPAIVIWGVRVNESRNDQTLYQKTTQLAKSLDDSRPTSGSMTGGSRKNWKKEWHQDVFAYDDYHSAADGSVDIEKPTEGVPYMLAEVVGQFSYEARKGFNNKYRRAGDLTLQVNQALYHAQAHDRAAASQGNSGAIAWCAFDYGSLINAYNGVKCPGVADVFRIPKLGAAFYQAQLSPKVRAVILPDFYWDFGSQTPRGPGKNAAIFSNCDRLEIFVAGKSIATALPDRKNYSHLQYPPFFCDLDVDGASHPELRIDGYVGGAIALSKSFSSDPSQDQFFLAPDDAELIADGSDATRLVFKVTDKFGAERAFATGEVSFETTGPGLIVGDNPFSLKDSGGVGAIWIKTAPSQPGRITLTAVHSLLGKKSIEINVQPETKG